MKIESLHLGMRIRHPQYGVGTVKAVSGSMAEIRFDDATRAIDPGLSGITAAEPSVAVTGLDAPLKEFVESVIEAVLGRMGYERPEAVVEQLGGRWQKGKLILHSADARLQAKEVPLEVFFHKIVSLRNQLRVLEQKINGHPKLEDAEKVEMQQYISRCYGSLTTFNLLFKNREDQFSSKGE